MENQTDGVSSDSFRLLDASELELFNRLREAMPSLIVFAQVSMSQVYYLHSRRVDRLTRFGDMGRESIDFLLCRRDDNGVVAAVALKAAGPVSKVTSDLDANKLSALRAVGIPVLVYVRNRLPEVQAIRKAINPLISSSPNYDRRQVSHARTQGLPRPF